MHEHFSTPRNRSTARPSRRSWRRAAAFGAAATAAVLLAAPAATSAATATSKPASAPTEASASRAPIPHWSDDALRNPGNYPVTELVGQFPLPKLKATEVHLSVTKWGFRYQGGMANNNLKITMSKGGLRFVDRAARTWTHLPRNCVEVKMKRAAAAQCSIPSRHPGQMYVETWPRLGNDTIDARGLSSRFKLWALTDDGRDTVRGGAGNDFINTAFMDDRAWGGDGDDWIRVGTGQNLVYGDGGNDRLVGGDNEDQIRGGTGDDRIGGLSGDDVLWGDAGADILVGGPGMDAAYIDAQDRASEIETMRS
ncbi:calcium-binding protein [Nocardioides sp. GXZ039]|uniref:calcium-binding protein n=1 Tax=Nocardioides sp. GXZ039 TaxID=3136018 RepID=UPI0030F48148